MAAPPAAGHVYLLDRHDGKPPHRWIILTDPDPIEGRLLAVSLTDKHNQRFVTDIWETGTQLCQGYRLAKPSALFMTEVVLEGRSYFATADLLGVCPPSILHRARCNLYWFPQFLAPMVKRIVNANAGDWNAGCGPRPRRSP